MVEAGPGVSDHPLADATVPVVMVLDANQKGAGSIPALYLRPAKELGYLPSLVLLKMCVGLDRLEQVAAEEVEHPVLYDEGPVLLQRLREAGQVGQFIESSVRTTDPIEVTSTAEKIGAGSFQGFVVEFADLVMVQSGEHAVGHGWIELPEEVRLDIPNDVLDLAGIQA